MSSYLTARILKRVNQEFGRGNAAESHLRKLSKAVEQSPESIVITDQHGIIEFVNDSLVRTSSYSRDELIGNNPRILQSGKTPPETYRNLWAALRMGKVWTGEFINLRKDGREYTEFAIISPIRQADGNITHYVAVMDDVTEKKNIAHELQQYRNHLLELVKERTFELEAERDRSAAAMRAKSEFLANMSHEIRTPLNAVIGFAGLCLQLELPARGRDYISKISMSAESLLGIVNDVLDVSKMEAGKLEFEHIAFDLGEVLERVNTLFNLKAADKGIALTMDCAPQVPARLLGDPLRLGQVLINLMGNAIKFTKAGSIGLRVGVRSSDLESVTLEFAVRDSGIGMSAQQLGNLFTAFTQADSSTTRQYGGTGLGLTISKQLVARMQGLIEVQSDVDVGSCFSFTARFGLPQQTDVTVFLGQAPQLLAAPDLRGRRILLVDDNDFNREIGLAQLALTGATVDTAENGALAVAAVNQHHYDLVLMDIQMPVLNGYGATRILRTSWPDLPIVALTAHAMTDEKDRVLAAGMNDILTKPVLLHLLYATLCRLLQRPSSTPHEPTHKEIEPCQN
jgi:two-component system sensor histidine kinase/response regulator